MTYLTLSFKEAKKLALKFFGDAGSDGYNLTI
jgi:hypothetical protein